MCRIFAQIVTAIELIRTGGAEQSSVTPSPGPEFQCKMKQAEECVCGASQWCSVLPVSDQALTSLWHTVLSGGGHTGHWYTAGHR